MNKDLKFIPEINKDCGRGRARGRERERDAFLNDLVKCKIIFYGGGSGRMKYAHGHLME